MEKDNKKENVIVLIVSIVAITLMIVVFFTAGTIRFKKNNFGSNQNVENPMSNQNVVEPSSRQSTDDDGAVEEEAEVFIVNEEASKIVDDVMNKFYDEVFFGHRETYCGNSDYNDVIENKDEATQGACNYYRSTTYNNLSSLKAYLETFISSDFIDYMLKDYSISEGNTGIPKYKEINNKLYCLRCARGALVFNKDATTYGIISYTGDEIKAIAKVAAFSEGNNLNYLKAILSLNKINGKWVLSSYEEKYGN